MSAAAMSSRIAVAAPLRAATRATAASRTSVVVTARKTQSGGAQTAAAAGRAYMESLPGVSAPLGFWDPLGLR